MKQHTQDFKEEIKLIGKQQDIQITFAGTTLTSEDINSATYSYEGSLLKSIMKQLELDSNVNIPINIEIVLKYGLLVNGEYEYIDFGKYIVNEVEKQEDTNSYLIKCYDKMIYSMKDYENIQITYPISVKDYLIAICNHLGLIFNDTDFANASRIINNELYLDENGNSLGYTFRDVLDEIAQVAGGVICINSNDEVEVRYVNDTDDTIDEEYFKDINVNFGKKYGPVNSIVLSRTRESDNIYLQDEESIASNGLCEIKIIDNQIMNFNDRSDYLPELLEKLNGLEYYINDFTSTGIMYYDLLDKYYAKIGDKVYNCLMLNDEINITQGLEEVIYTNEPEISETDYSKSDKTDIRINQVYSIVDKQAGEILSVVTKVEENTTTLTQTTQKANDLTIQAQELTNELQEVEGKLENVTNTVADMSYSFGTQGLKIATSQDVNNSVLDNTGVRVYNYNKLQAIFNYKGSGIDKLIVTGNAQIGYLRFVKSTKDYQKVTKIFHLDQLIENLEDLEV